MRKEGKRYEKSLPYCRRKLSSLEKNPLRLPKIASSTRIMEARPKMLPFSLYGPAFADRAYFRLLFAYRV
jgi:hypothetical protein